MPLRPHFHADQTGQLTWQLFVVVSCWLVAARNAIGLCRHFVVLEPPRDENGVGTSLPG